MEVNVNYVFKTLEGKPVKLSPSYSEAALKGIAQILGIDLRILLFENPKREAAAKAIQVILDNEENFTLKKACTDALNGKQSDEKDLSGDDKFSRGALAVDIYKSNGKIDLSSENITLLKKLISKSGSNMIIFQAFGVLDPKKKK